MLVIGAGLAGAAVADALTRRGKEVTLIDEATGPASRASALPVGVLSPHQTKSPTPMSRLSEIGAADMHAELARLLPEGTGWRNCTIHNLGHAPGHWPAALVRPSEVVDAWLSSAADTGRLQTQWNCAVHTIRRNAGPDAKGDAPLQWEACTADGQTIATGDSLVIAGAWGSMGLLARSGLIHANTDLPLRPVKGQMSFGALPESLSSRERSASETPVEPMRDNGVYVPSFETNGASPIWPARMWAMGSTYERNTDSREVSLKGHERNLASLEALSSEGAEVMRKAMAAGELLGWSDVRCASLDRLPLIGAMPDFFKWSVQERPRRGLPRQLDKRWVPLVPGLYLVCALGSRGLTLAHWAADYVAALVDGQTPDLEADLARSIDPARFNWRLWRQQEHGSAEPEASAVASAP